MQPRQQPFQIVPPARLIAIHPPDTRPWKDLREPLLALLRARAQIVQMLAVALRTPRRHRPLVPAVMALQPLPRPRDSHVVPLGAFIREVNRWLMMRQGNRAIHALQLFSARATDHRERIASPIQEDERLLAS